MIMFYLNIHFIIFLGQPVNLNAKSRGTTISGITKKQLETLEFPLPPRPEQERIVAKIEETFTQLEAGVAELQNAKAQLKRYRAAVLKSAVEGELTREWREAHQGEIEPAEKLLARILVERRKKWEAEGGKGKYKEPVEPNTDDLPELPEGWIWAAPDQLASTEKYALAIGPFGSNLKVFDYTDDGIPLVYCTKYRSEIFDSYSTKFVQ